MFYNEQTYTGECAAALVLCVCMQLDRLKKLVGNNMSAPVILLVRTRGGREGGSDHRRLQNVRNVLIKGNFEVILEKVKSWS